MSAEMLHQCRGVHRADEQGDEYKPVVERRLEKEGRGSKHDGGTNGHLNQLLHERAI